MTNRLISRRLIAELDKPISRLALGTGYFTNTDRDTWFGLLDCFCELGGTTIDCARLYGGGVAEQVLGEWLTARGVREQIVLITKCAHGGSAALLPDEGFEDTVTREREQSLATLHTNYIDLYLLHRDNPAVPVGRIVERMHAEVRNGYARAIGVSNWTYDRVEEAAAYAAAHSLTPFVVVSNNLSLAVPAEPFYPRLVSVDQAGELWHQRTGTLLLSWSALGRGFFTGRFSGGAAADAFGARMQQVYGSPENSERLRRATDLGRRKGAWSASQVALAWLLHRPFPLVPVVGPHTQEELLSCIAATRLELSPQDCAWLNLQR